MYSIKYCKPLYSDQQHGTCVSLALVDISSAQVYNGDSLYIQNIMASHYILTDNKVYVPHLF